MNHFQPFDEVTHHDRPALFMHLWPDGVLARIRYSDTGQKRSVMLSEVAPFIDPTVKASVDAVRAAFDDLERADG